jgi:hypothetical protein
VKQTFEARLISRGPGGAWTFLPIPFDVHKAFGTRARVAVSGTINGFPFRNSLMPEGDGTHSMMFSKALQAGAKASVGDLVRVVLEPDDTEPEIAVPAELQQRFRKNKQAASFFASLTASQKKEFADWVASAKQTTTKAARATKALELLAAGKKRLR